MKYAKDQRYDESGIATHCGQVSFKKNIKKSLKQRSLISVNSQELNYAFLVQVLPAVSANKLSELQEMAG